MPVVQEVSPDETQNKLFLQLSDIISNNGNQIIIVQDDSEFKLDTAHLAQTNSQYLQGLTHSKPKLEPVNVPIPDCPQKMQQPLSQEDQNLLRDLKNELKRDDA